MNTDVMMNGKQELIMLKPNQIKRLIAQCEKQQPQHPREWNRITGWIEALTLVLNGDPETINNKPINQEK